MEPFLCTSSETFEAENYFTLNSYSGKLMDAAIGATLLTAP